MTRAFPSHPRIAFAVRAAAEFLLEANAALLPIDPFALAQSRGWRVQPFSRAADRMQLSLGDFRSIVGTQEAFTAVRRRPVIFYNDTIACRERIVFSLCHEIGHIALRHFTDFRPDALTHAQLALLDAEANAFAANLLAPPMVVCALQPGRRMRSREIFGLSQAAWRNRLAELDADRAFLSPEAQKAQLQQFDRWMHALRCRDCGTAFHGDRHARCPACGSVQLSWDPQRAAGRIMHPWTGEGWRLTARPSPAGRTSTMLSAELDNPMAEDR